VPDDVGSRLRHLGHLHETRSNRCIQPGNNALIDLHPFSVVPHVLGVDGAINMIDQSKLVKICVEEGAPSREHRVAIVESDRHMSADIDVLDGSEGDGGGRVVTEGILRASNGGSRAGRHGQRMSGRRKNGSEKTGTI
jgi:hypothetical protein